MFYLETKILQRWQKSAGYQFVRVIISNKTLPASVERPIEILLYKHVVPLKYQAYSCFRSIV